MTEWALTTMIFSPFILMALLMFIRLFDGLDPKQPTFADFLNSTLADPTPRVDWDDFERQVAVELSGDPWAELEPDITERAMRLCQHSGEKLTPGCQHKRWNGCVRFENEIGIWACSDCGIERPGVGPGGRDGPQSMIGKFSIRDLCAQCGSFKTLSINEKGLCSDCIAKNVYSVPSNDTLQVSAPQLNICLHHHVERVIKMGSVRPVMYLCLDCGVSVPTTDSPFDLPDIDRLNY